MPQKSATGQKWIGRIKKLRERGTVKGVGMVSPEGQSKLEIDWKMPALEALKEGETYTKDEILALLRKRDVEVTMEGGHLGEKETPLEVDTFWSDDVMGDSVEFDRDAEEVLANLPDALPQPAAGYMGNLTPHMGSETNQVLPRTSPLTASDVEVYYIRDNTLDDDGGTNPFYLFKFKNFESYFISYFKRNAAEKGWNLSHIDPSVVKRERTRFEEGGNTLVYTSYEGLDNNFQNFQGWHGIPLETAMEDLEEIIKEFYEDGPGRDMDRSGSQYDSDYYEGSTLSGPRENGTRIKLKVTPDESQAIPRTQQHFAEDELGWARVDERILADINLNLKTNGRSSEACCLFLLTSYKATGYRVQVVLFQHSKRH